MKRLLVANRGEIAAPITRAAPLEAAGSDTATLERWIGSRRFQGKEEG